MVFHKLREKMHKSKHGKFEFEGLRTGVDTSDVSEVIEAVRQQGQAILDKSASSEPIDNNDLREFNRNRNTLGKMVQAEHGGDSELTKAVDNIHHEISAQGLYEQLQESPRP